MSRGGWRDRAGEIVQRKSTGETGGGPAPGKRTLAQQTTPRSPSPEASAAASFAPAPELGSAITGGLGEAFAVGNQVAFRNDSPSPQLVGHELAHTVQQGAVAQTSLMKKDANAPSSDGLETEADRAGEAAARGEPVSIAGRVETGAVQRFQ